MDAPRRTTTTSRSDLTVGSAAAAGAAILFGSAYVATAFQLDGFTPLGGALWRSALAASVLLLLTTVRGVRSRGRGLPQTAWTLGRIGRLVLLGVLGGLVFIVGMNLAVSQVGATITAFVAGLYAIVAALFAPIVLRERLERRALAGFIVALAGTVLLAELNPSPDTAGGLAAGGVAAVSYGLYLVLIRRWSAAIDVGPVGVSLATGSTATIGLLIFLGLFDPNAARVGVATTSVAVATVWLACVTAFGPLLATAALRRVEASVASSMLLLNPITATILAVILLGERPSPAQLFGGLLVLLGMALATDVVGVVNRRRNSRLGTEPRMPGAGDAAHATRDPTRLP